MATILLIEDNPSNARLIYKVLEAHHHTIIHAPNALEGLRLIQEHPVDLVLLDLDLPDLDGKIVANRIRNMPSVAKVKIVAVTSNATSSAKRLSLAYGCDGFLTKPIDTREFPKQVAVYLGENLEKP